MPKQVDHDERRAAIVDALFRVAARDGLVAVSIRSVATEAGIPAAQVQYYFGTKASLLDAALAEVGGRVIGRGMALIEAAGENPPPEALMRAALTGSHPTDDASRGDLVLFFEFLNAALSESSMTDSRLVEAQRFITTSFADMIRQAQQRGEAPKTIDPEREARLILFANTGLVQAALIGIHSVEDAIAALEYHLQRVFPPKATKGRRRT